MSRGSIVGSGKDEAMIEFLNYDIINGFRIFHIILVVIGVFCVWVAVNTISVMLED